MNPADFAWALEQRLQRWGLSREKAAEAAAWPRGEALRVLEGDPTAPLGAVLALCDVARCDLQLAPWPEQAWSDPSVTAPSVVTKVGAALDKVRRMQRLG